MYQNYTTSGQLVLPMDVEVLIPVHHLCRIVDLAVEQMNPNILLSLHPGGGRPPYHPKMMLKIIKMPFQNKGGMGSYLCCPQFEKVGNIL